MRMDTHGCEIANCRSTAVTNEDGFPSLCRSDRALVGVVGFGELLSEEELLTTELMPPLDSLESGLLMFVDSTLLNIDRGCTIGDV